MNILQWLFAPAQSDPFNKATDAFRQSRRFVDDRDMYCAALIETVQHCQAAIAQRKTHGDAHVLMANAYFVLGSAIFPAGSEICMPCATATICHWKTNPMYTKNKSNGDYLYHGIVSEWNSPSLGYPGSLLYGDLAETHDQYYPKALSPDTLEALMNIVSSLYQH